MSNIFYILKYHQRYQKAKHLQPAQHNQSTQTVYNAVQCMPWRCQAPLKVGKAGTHTPIHIHTHTLCWHWNCNAFSNQLTSHAARLWQGSIKASRQPVESMLSWLSLSVAHTPRCTWSCTAAGLCWAGCHCGTRACVNNAWHKLKHRQFLSWLTASMRRDNTNWVEHFKWQDMGECRTGPNSWRRNGRRDCDFVIVLLTYHTHTHTHVHVQASLPLACKTFKYLPLNMQINAANWGKEAGNKFKTPRAWPA